MSDWGDLIEDRIREAMERGDFDDLPGKGKPLKLDDAPPGGSGAWAAHHLLKANGYTLPWIEERAEIDAGVAAARAALKRAYSYAGAGLSRRPPDAWAESHWQAASAAFREQAAALNQRIRDHNLKLPDLAFHCPPLNPEREIARLTAPGQPST